jgi:hypothetical protein
MVGGRYIYFIVDIVLSSVLCRNSIVTLHLGLSVSSKSYHWCLKRFD